MTFDGYTIRLVQDGDLEDLFALIDNNRSRLEAFFAGTVAKHVRLPIRKTIWLIS